MGVVANHLSDCPPQVMVHPISGKCAPIANAAGRVAGTCARQLRSHRVVSLSAGSTYDTPGHDGLLPRRAPKPHTTLGTQLESGCDVQGCEKRGVRLLEGARALGAQRYFLSLDQVVRDLMLRRWPPTVIVRPLLQYG